MITDLAACHNRPDIVVFLKRDHRILCVEIACPADIDKEDEKVAKYMLNKTPRVQKRRSQSEAAVI